jgi:ArsR family transcriptional regulator
MLITIKQQEKRSMESAELLDILGNKNRRKIIQLLSSRPYYITEISDRIGVGPKAVLGHLGLLEQSGLIKADMSDQRRKYYHIAEKLKLEVFVSPYSYTVETSSVTQHAPSEIDQVTSKKNNTRSQSIESLKQMNKNLYELESKRRKLADKQREIEGEMTNIISGCIDLVHNVAKDLLEAEIIVSLLKQPQNIRNLSMNMRLPEYFIEEHIRSLIDRQIIIERKKDNIPLLSLI